MGTLSGLGRPTGEELIAKQVFRSASQAQLVWLIGIIARIYNPLFAPISRKNATTGNDGKTYIVSFYNLDVIIPLGCKVHSQNGIMFRKWANSGLNE